MARTKMFQSLEKIAVVEEETYTFKELQMKADEYINILSNNLVVPSNESFGSFIKKLFVGIANLLIHVINNFKTMIFKGFKNLKRSELKAYHESNALSINKIYKLDFNEIRETKTPMPKGLTTSYKKATEIVVNALDNYNTEDLCKSGLEVIKNIHIGFQSGKSVSQYIDSANSSADVKSIERKYNEVMKCFSGKETEGIFYKCFTSMDDLKYTDVELLKAEKYLLSVDTVHGYLGDMKLVIDKIISGLSEVTEGDLPIDKKDILNLAQLIRSLAETFDYFGSTVNRLHILEHNLCEVFKVLNK